MYSILFIGLTWPEPTTTAAGNRILQLIRFFKTLNYTIHFATTSSFSDKSYDLSKLSVECHKVTLNDESFNDFIKKLKPDFTLFDRFLTEEYFGWRVNEFCPTSIRILDTEDLHFLRHAREKNLTNNKEVTLKELQNKIAEREIASIYKSDLTLLISKFEKELLENKFNINPTTLQYTPFFVDINILTTKKHRNFNERNDFVFVGNFKHKPNVDAVIQLKKYILPKIKAALPDSKIYIYGAYANEEIQKLNNQSFIIKGWEPNTEEIFLNHRVLLAPLRFGAGLKGKLIDAMMYGLPSVTTSIGSEGISDTDEWNGFITNSFDKFVENAIFLYENEDYWNSAVNKGLEILKANFNTSLHKKSLTSKLTYLTGNIKKHREVNFLSKILYSNQLNASKFLSKYIEEKNKKLL